MARRPRPTEPDARNPDDDPIENDPIVAVETDQTGRRGRNSRLATADVKRAAEKALGPMSASKDTDADLRLDISQPPPERSDGMKKSRAASKASKPLDKGSAKTGGVDPDTPVPVRVTRSNAEIAESTTSTARKSPAPRSARTEGGFSGEGARDPGKPARRTGSERQRAPAPGNAVSITKHRAIRSRTDSGDGA